MGVLQLHTSAHKHVQGLISKRGIGEYNRGFTRDQSGGANTNFSGKCPLFSRLCVGYRIRLGSSTDKKDTGRLHVDFAQARDDLYEWECRQRMLAREERHRRKMEEDRLRPPSPPPIVHYSEHECSQLGEKIKGWQTFQS